MHAFSVSKSPDGHCQCKNKRWRGISDIQVVLPFYSTYPTSIFLLLFACGGWSLTPPTAIHTGSQKSPRTHPTTDYLHLALSLSLHNHCITTAGRNAFPSQQLWHSLHSLSSRLIPRSCRGRRRAPAAHGTPLQRPSAAEAFCHFWLSPPNPLCWPQSDQRLVKKQMAVTDTVHNCGQLIAEDKSEIRTKRWWPAAAKLTLPGITSAGLSCLQSPRDELWLFPVPSLCFLPFHPFQGLTDYWDKEFKAWFFPSTFQSRISTARVVTQFLSGAGNTRSILNRGEREGENLSDFSKSSRPDLRWYTLSINPFKQISCSVFQSNSAL